MSDKTQCPCGYRGGVTSDVPPFWELDGQVWHLGCLLQHMPELREEIEAIRARRRAAGLDSVWTARIIGYSEPKDDGHG